MTGTRLTSTPPLRGSDSRRRPSPPSSLPTPGPVPSSIGAQFSALSLPPIFYFHFQRGELGRDPEAIAESPFSPFRLSPSLVPVTSRRPHHARPRLSPHGLGSSTTTMFGSLTHISKSTSNPKYLSLLSASTALGGPAQRPAGLVAVGGARGPAETADSLSCFLEWPCLHACGAAGLLSLYPVWILCV